MLSIFLLILCVQFTFSQGPSCSQDFLRRGFASLGESKEITVVTDTDSYPFASRIGNGVPFGFDIDLFNYIGFIYGIEFKYVFESFSELIPTVKQNRSVISIGTQTVTTDRIRLVDFAQFFRTSSGFIAQSSYSQTINGLSDLCGKTVVVQATSIQETDVQQQNNQCGGSPITILSVAGYSDVIGYVSNGTAEVGVQDEALLATSVMDSNDQLKLVGNPYNVEPYGIMCNKKNRGVCCALVNAINFLIRDGVYEKLLKRYGFSYKNNGVCPSKINLDGTACSPVCEPTMGQCIKRLN